MSAESMIGVAADSATDEGLPQSFEELARRLGVRSLTLHRNEILSEAGTELDAPLIQAAAVAVVSNPWTGTGPDEDLGPATEKLAPVLAKVLTDRLLLALGAPDRVEAFGKAAVVGTAGELEHAGALIHTPYFGNIMREMLDGTSVLCFADGRAAASASIRVPMWHKTHATSRDHYQSIEVRLPDAPTRTRSASSPQRRAAPGRSRASATVAPTAP